LFPLNVGRNPTELVAVTTAKAARILLSKRKIKLIHSFLQCASADEL